MGMRRRGGVGDPRLGPAITYDQKRRQPDSRNQWGFLAKVNVKSKGNFSITLYQPNFAYFTIKIDFRTVSSNISVFNPLALASLSFVNMLVVWVCTPATCKKGF